MPINNFCLFIILVLILYSNANDHLPGHLKPLGSQVEPVGDVLTIDTIPSPQEFFEQYVHPGKPVLFKGAAAKTPAYNLWTDEYLSSKFGKLKFDVEEGKKENRSRELFNMPLDEFLNSYKEKDIYLVASVPKMMQDDLYLLRCLLCGGFTDDLQDSVMWFSNGGTKSVLHFDAIDNINCLMSGTKELFMVDKKKHAHILIDKPDGSFSNVDVDKVDLQKYPGFADVPWYKAMMEPGDCLFIPYRWFHQVRSYGPRNLAINIWFGHKLKFNSTDCEHSPYKDQQFAPLSEFKVSENLGASLSLFLIDKMEEKPVDLKKFLEIVQDSWPNKDLKGEEGVKILQDIFKVVDVNQDSLLSPEEVVDSSLKEYEKKLMKQFPYDGDDDDDSDSDSDGEEVDDMEGVEDSNSGNREEL